MLSASNKPEKRVTTPKSNWHKVQTQYKKKNAKLHAKALQESSFEKSGRVLV